MNNVHKFLKLIFMPLQSTNTLKKINGAELQMSKTTSIRYNVLLLLDTKCSITISQLPRDPGRQSGFYCRW